MSTTPSPPDAPRRRRWQQFSLRTVLVVMTVVAVSLGLWADSARKQRRAVEMIRQHGGMVRYHWSEAYGHSPWWPAWLEKMVGVDYLNYVEEACLSGETLRDADLAQLQALPHLEYLSISNSSVSDAALVHLKGLTKLWCLRLDDPRGTRRVRNDQEKLWFFERGEGGDIPANSWPSPEVDLFAPPSGLDQSTVLDFDAYPLQDVLRYVMQYHDLAIAVTVAARGVMERPDGCPVTYRTRGIPLRSALDAILEPLGLAWYVREGTVVVTVREKSPEATHLTGVGLENLETLPCLRVLMLNACECRCVGLRQLHGLARLERLDVTDTPFTDAALGCFRDVPQLDGLDLRGTLITDAGLAALEGKKNIVELFLGGTQVTDVGMAHLAGLSQLRFLDLSGTMVGDAGLAALEGKTELQDLYLGGTRVTDAGLAHLAGLPQLHCLDLSDTAVTDAGLAHLESLRALTRLYLIRIPLTDAAVPHLVRMESLRILHCDGHQISKTKQAALRATRGLYPLGYSSGRPLRRSGAKPPAAP